MATINHEKPEQRMVVLRAVDAKQRVLTFYTDRRTPKVAQMISEPKVACHFFDSRRMAQLRFTGLATIHVEGNLWRNHWSGLSERGKRDYAVLGVPGTQAEGEIVYDPALAEANFTVVQIECQTLDWLLLSREGHKRAYFDWDRENPIANHTLP